MTYRAKKLIAFFLTLVMVFNIMPVSSFAAEGDENKGENIIEDISKSFDEEIRHHESRQLPKWVPSMKKR